MRLRAARLAPRTLTRLLCLAATLGLAIAACGLLPGRSAPTAKVRVVTTPFLGLAPIFLAQDEGYFAEQHLAVEFVPLEATSTAIPALARGEVDALIGTANVGVFNAIARGSRVKIVADRDRYAVNSCPGAALVARRALVESGALASPAQLRGHRLSVTRGNFEEYWVEKLLAPAGLTLDDMTVVDLPPQAELDAMRQGTLDVASATEPWITQLVRTADGVVWAGAQQAAPDFQHSFLVYGPGLLDRDQDAGRRFMVAYLKAIRAYDQGKSDRRVEILARNTKLDPGLVRDTCWSPGQADGQINTDSLMDFQAWAVRKGLLERPVAPAQFWDPSFVEAANRVLGSGGS